MNRGTPANIMTQLGMTSDQYALLTIFYYVGGCQIWTGKNGKCDMLTWYMY